VSRGGATGGWWTRAFGADYLRVYGHRDDAEAAADVAAWVGKSPGIARGARVLDLACGAGRHLRALRAAGVRGVGMVLAPELLREAARRGSGPVARGDLRALPFRDGAFDAVLCFFTSFGYFDDAREDAGALAEAGRVLAPGGLLVVDLPDAAHVRANLVGRSERDAGEETLVEERRLADGGARVEKALTLRGPDGARTWTESVRLYEPAEVEAMATAAGLRPIERRAGHGPDAWTPGRGPRCVLVLRRSAA
jgi:SAM-dependent methyltransferase